MKAIQELVAALEQWRFFEIRVMDKLNPKLGITPKASRPDQEPSGRLYRPLQRVLPAGPDPGGIAPAAAPCRAVKRRKGIRHPKLAFLITVLTLTAVLGQRFYNQPGLQVGSVPAETIVAPSNARVEDTETTEERRRDARNGALLILKIDSTTDETVLRSLDNLVDQVSGIRRDAGSVPFLPTSTLSTQVQGYLRQADDASWLKIRGLVEPSTTQAEADDALALESLLQAPKPIPR
jgi:hypothetical protein